MADRLLKWAHPTNCSKWFSILSELPRAVMSDILQGLVLGPVLVIIFSNDLPNKVQSQIHLFANDTKIYWEIISEHVVEIFRSGLKVLDEWSRKWLLLFHPDKCKVLNLGEHKVPAEYYMTDIGKNQEIKLHVCESEKDLGIWTHTSRSGNTTTWTTISVLARYAFWHLLDTLFR